MGSGILAIAFGIILIIIGIAIIVEPEVVWDLQEAWKVDDFFAQPSKSYLISTRISGILLIGFALFMIYAAFKYG